MKYGYIIGESKLDPSLFMSERQTKRKTNDRESYMKITGGGNAREYM